MADFIWGQGGERITPQEAARQREMAQALMGQNSTVATNPWEGLAQIARATTGTVLDGRADAAEQAGRSELSSLLAGIGPDTDMSTLMSIYGNGWANPQEQAIAELLINQNMKQQAIKDERAYQAGLTADERAYQQGLISDQRAYNAGLLADERTYNQPSLDADLAFKQAQTEALLAKPAIPLTDDQREFAQAKTEGFTGTLQDWIAQKPRTGAVTVNTGDNSSAFAKKADEQAATRLDNVIQEGNNASRFLGDVQQLASLGSQINTGQGAAVLNQLGPWAELVGINIDGLDASQAYESIVARMAPQMRPAGSGASSDFDARQFLTSLPSLRNTPEGNKLITDTFAAIQENKMMAAELAAKAMLPPEDGGITWQEAERQIRALPNPYELFKRNRTPNVGGPSAANASQTNPAAPPPPTGTVEDGYRFKGGDPADPNNWEQVR